MYFSSDDSHLYCLNAANGSLLWKYSTSCSNKPVIYNGNLYFDSWDNTNGYLMKCLDAVKGTFIWRYKLEYGPYGFPVIYNNKLYFSTDKFLYCLTIYGDFVWKFDGRPYRSPPCLANDKVYFGSWDSRLYCIDANDGTLLWRFREYETNYDIETIPTVYKGKVYFGSYDSYIYCLETEEYAINKHNKSNPSRINYLLFQTHLRINYI